MKEHSDVPFFSGRPMDVCSLADEEDALRTLPKGAQIVSLEDARENLPKVIRWLAELQAMSDEAHDLTEELEVLLESLEAESEHVVEVAEQLAQLVAHWQNVTSKIEATGTRIACLEPGRLEWYGVVDQHLALYSWRFGEEDIEWYHPIDSTFLARKPLIEA
ncbi:MAG: DUF2203 family protein [Euryarchaeota archaeon]|nr:DUF2203 family protein [Euryarchaeota archaeon]MBT5595239.1 DUF2203 family protein [Euryarchaeota archaeon]MBT5844475.1 DUF2203 family protein [Euryarchaeota archaeon]MBT6640323.1 DUF2203 family protein [Euryarchaeota archaeon]MBT6845031.1 DUF2203 family protein [Euryarchaeota archaeon]